MTSGSAANKLRAFIEDETAAAALEYALLAAILSVGTVSIVGAIRGAMFVLFNDTADDIDV